MEIDFTISLNYGEEGPSDNEPTPSEEEIAEWIINGMANAGFTSANVTCKQQ